MTRFTRLVPAERAALAAYLGGTAESSSLSPHEKGERAAFFEPFIRALPAVSGRVVAKDRRIDFDGA